MQFYEPIQSVLSQSGGAGVLGLSAQLASVIYNANVTNQIINQLDSDDQITVEVFTEERHNSELTITEHPVEAGTPMSDHAFMLPLTLNMTCIFSQSSLSNLFSDAVAFGSSVISGESYSSRLMNIYKKFIDFQKNRVLLTIQTTKKRYENMLLKSITIPVNPQNYNVLELQLEFREVILAHVKTVEVTGVVTEGLQKSIEAINNGTARNRTIASCKAGEYFQIFNPLNPPVCPNTQAGGLP